MTKIKICGITREQDAIDAISFGVDALGFVFYDKSKRFVSPEKISWIKNLPENIKKVGLFVNPEKDYLNLIMNELPIDILQFHGNESHIFCKRQSTLFKKCYIKAVPMQSLNETQAIDYINNYPTSSGFLFDNYGKDEIGGSGQKFNWNNMPQTKNKRIILAGGLTVSNISSAIKQIKPYAVDISSGVEVSAGIKSKQKMKDFIEQVKA